MKQLKSSREYWPKRHHKLTKKICLQVEGKGKVCQFIPILVKFTFLSNSWLNKLQNMPCRIFYPWTCDWNLIFALSDTELEIFWQLLFFVLMFISFLSLIADIFWNIRISFLAVSDSNGCPNLNTRHFGPGAANHDCPLGGEGGQMMVIQEM